MHANVKPDALLVRGLQELDLEHSATQINVFMIYLSELKKWSRTYNLTSNRKDEDIIIKHFLDSLLYVRGIPQEIITLADAGSGAGFPGIPIKIMRNDLAVSLIESSKKKTAFLRHIIRLLKLEDTEVIEGRLEELGNRQTSKYDVIVSRATFKLTDILRKICPQLSRESLLLLSKGPGVREELQALEKSPEFRGAVQKVLKLRLPLSGDERNLVILQCLPRLNQE